MDSRSEQLLVGLGLSAYESRCYVALLRGFPVNPYQLSKRAGIPASKIYEIVAKLEERGLAAKLGGEAGYVPKDPATAMSEWRSRYLRDLAEVTEALEGELSVPGVQMVWNLDSTQGVREQGGRLLAEAQTHVSLAASAEMINLWRGEIEEARTRGVLLRLISYGRPVEALHQLLAKMYPDRRGAQPSTAGSPAGGAGVLAVDHLQVLFVSSSADRKGLKGVWTDNPAMAMVAEEYVDDKLFIEKVLDSGWSPWGDTDY